ncbi:MAG: glycoside hydrolase family 13 protein [Saprospiraceae bacterium]
MKNIIFFLFLLPLFAFSQSSIERVEPDFWWTGMNNTQLQIMVYGKNISHLKPQIKYEGISIQKTVSMENNNYLFIYLNIDKNTAAGDVKIEFKNAENKTVLTRIYPILKRKANAALIKGYNNADVMCLITPDRFANGNPSNDNIEGMVDTLNRSDKWGRHGGDIKGLIDHLDYFSEMGFTAIWLNPILENKQPQWSYHGYATTDYYKVDARFGTNEDYLKLAVKARGMGIKIIMDMIVNHCGSGHWWMNDLPSKDWINNPDHFIGTSHRRTTLRDPYSSEYDTKNFSDGWFVKAMPDLNQRNPEMATYLIQNTIWWIEYLGLSGIRMDTYPYSDKDFLRDWTCAVMDEYPYFNICGEEWNLNPIILAYWQKGKLNPDGYTSCLPGLLDFPLQHAFVNALMDEEKWNSGMVNLYEMLSLDFIYADPFQHVIFPDNHDMSRIFTQLNEDYDFLKMAIIYFSTMRGTPQFYYGTEILMSNKGDDSHGNIRSDFPGGWEGDKINAFTGVGLTDKQKDMQAFFKKILNWRKKSIAIHDGKLMHFAPQENVYVYFRYSEQQKIMVVLNKTDEEREIDLAQYAEMLDKGATGKDIISEKEIILNEKLTLEPKQALVFEINER